LIINVQEQKFGVEEKKKRQVPSVRFEGHQIKNEEAVKVAK